MTLINTITLYAPFRVCTDGSISRAELLIDNYLWLHEREKFCKILEKYGLKELVNWRMFDGDFDAVLIYVRVEDIDLMEEMLAEIVRESKKCEEEHQAMLNMALEPMLKAQAKLDGIVKKMNVTENNEIVIGS